VTRWEAGIADRWDGRPGGELRHRPLFGRAWWFWFPRLTTCDVPGVVRFVGLSWLCFGVTVTVYHRD
jgi:hypothetical protein